MHPKKKNNENVNLVPVKRNTVILPEVESFNKEKKEKKKTKF